MKNLIKRIRDAKTWPERVEIAHDKFPGTDFDLLFVKASKAKEFIDALPANFKNAPYPILRKDYRYELALQNFEQLGAWLATMINSHEFEALHKLADAVRVLKAHKPQPDYDLISLFQMTGMFPPGWEKNWFTGLYSRSPMAEWRARGYTKSDFKSGRLEQLPRKQALKMGWTKEQLKQGNPIFGVKADTRAAIAMRDIRRSIENKLGRKLNDDEWERRRKKLQRHAKEFKIPLDHTPSSRK